MAEPRKPRKTYGRPAAGNAAGRFARELWSAVEGRGRNGGGGSGGRQRSRFLDDEDDEEEEEEGAKRNGSGNGKARAPAGRVKTAAASAADSDTDPEGEDSEEDSEDEDEDEDSSSSSEDADTDTAVTVTVTPAHNNNNIHPRPRTHKPAPPSGTSDTDDDSDDDDRLPSTPEHDALEANILALLAPTAAAAPAAAPAPETSDKENDLPPHTPAPVPSSPASPREALKERPLTPTMTTTATTTTVESPARKHGVRKKHAHRASITSPLREQMQAGIKVWEDGGGDGGEREMTEKMRRVTILEVEAPVAAVVAETPRKPVGTPGKVGVIDLTGETPGRRGVVDLTGATPGRRWSGSGSGSELSEPEPEAGEYDGEYDGEYGDYTDEPPLEDLLRLCTAPTVLDFTAHITALQTTSTLQKLGEASYSEVFLCTPHTSTPAPPTVLKIIPFGSADQCGLRAIVQELSITRTMAPLRGFIGFRGAHVCAGAFPGALMACWDAYEEERGSENERPEFYEADQMWVLVGLEMGGTDLEHFVLEGWGEALDVFWQVAEALAEGERRAQFEHRDLHYGNIVIQRLPDGLKASLIDYTLSRALCPSPDPSTPTAHFAPLDDPALFSGKGDYQFDIYRFMRAHVSSGLVPPDEEALDWDVYAPRTNVFWLHYLAVVLLRRKGLPRGRRRCGGDAEWKALQALEGVERGIDPRRRRFGAEAGRQAESAGEVVGGWR